MRAARGAGEDALAGLHRQLDAALDLAGAENARGLVAATWPLEGEPDLRPLLRFWHSSGRAVCLPRTHAPGTPLSFHVWTPDVRMRPGPYGTSHPEGPAVRPGIVLVPLLAFDRHGRRLGYGGGFYDRTLTALAGVRTIGFGWSWQEVTNVPVDQYDRPLDIMATEVEVIRVGV